MTKKQEIHIEDFLIWAYQKEAVYEAAKETRHLNTLEKYADGIYTPATSGDGSFQIYKNTKLGAKIDSQYYNGAKVHPDAEYLHHVIESDLLTKDQRFLVFSYGKTSLEPDPMVDVQPRLVPEKKENGKVKVLYNRSRKPYVSLLKTINPPKYIEYKREVYTDWYMALHTLFMHLSTHSMNMKNHEVLPPKSKEMPWL